MKQEMPFKQTLQFDDHFSKADNNDSYGGRKSKSDNDTNDDNEDDSDDLRVTGGPPSILLMKRELPNRRNFSGLSSQQSGYFSNNTDPSSSSFSNNNISDPVLTAPQPNFFEVPSSNYSMVTLNHDTAKMWMQLSSNTIDKQDQHLLNPSLSTLDDAKHPLSSISTLTTPLYQPFYTSYLNPTNNPLPSDRYEMNIIYQSDQPISVDKKDWKEENV